MKSMIRAITLSLAMLPAQWLYSQAPVIDSFTIQPGNAGKIWLRWSLAPSDDPAGTGFEIQRSKDKIQWTTIALQRALQSHRYTFEDRPGDSVTYYRIVQHLGEGKIAYSEIKWIQVNTTTNIFLWPNPAKNILHIKTAFSTGTIEIIDASGRWVNKIIITNFITDISTAALSKGIYFLYIRHSNQLVVQRFVKD